MSTTELPPIVNKDKPRPSSRSTSRSSLHQMTAAVRSKNIYNRLKAGVADLPRNHSDPSLVAMEQRATRNHSDPLSKTSQRTMSRNHSDSSLKGFTAATSPRGRSQGPPSVRSHVGQTSAQGNEVGSLGPRKHNANRALSWCSPDTNTSSTPRLETLFEMRDAANNNVCTTNTNDNNTSAILNPHIKTNNNNNVSLLATLSSSLSNHKMYNSDAPPLPENETHKDSKDLQTQLAASGVRKRLQSEGSPGEGQSVRTVQQSGRPRLGSMRRSMSDNKLVDRHQQHQHVQNTAATVGRRQPVSVALSREKTLDWKASPQGSKERMRRFNSVSVLNASSSNAQSRQDSVFADGNDVEDRSGDSTEEEEERKLRITQWLIGAEAADVPPEPDIEYAEDPPQTDTALHIVHQED